MKSNNIIEGLILILAMGNFLNAQWQPDFRVTYDDSSSRTSWNNNWAVTANGSNVCAVWFDTRDNNQEIYFKCSNDTGMTWGADVRLTNNVSNSQNPGIAHSGDTLHAVWQDNRDGNYEIYYKRSTDAGSNWGADTRLSINSSWSGLPSIAVSGSRVYVAWSDDRDGNREVYFIRSFDAGQTWGSESRLTNTADWGWTPSIAASGDTVHIAWYESVSGSNTAKDIHYIRSTSAGTSWEVSDTLTNDPANSSSPSIGVAGSSVHVVWNDNRDGNWEIYYKRSTDGGLSWGADTRLTNDPSVSSGASVAVSSSNVHVVWDDSRDQNEEIYYKSSGNMGFTWSPDLRLTNNSSTSMYGSVAAFGPVVHVVWYDNRDANWEVYYKRNPTGNLRIDDNDLDHSREPQTRIIVQPNPFHDRAVVKGLEGEDLRIFNAAGGYVRTDKGRALGRGLSPGVYFILTSKNDVFVKIIKAD
jgi:hypothetical protein